MARVARIIVTLKSGILDAAGQAVRQGLHALGYGEVKEVRVGRYLEITVPDGMSEESIQAMCERFLANPLIEHWRVELEQAAAQAAEAAPPAKPASREVH